MSACAVLETPTGPFWIRVADGAVTASGWGFQKAEGKDAVLAQAVSEVQRYFSGECLQFTVPVAPAVAGFTARVLDQIAAIPYGETREYGDIARALGAPAQAVGQACGANPIPVLIPCHRVLSARGLGGFSGAGGVETKVALLRLEGAASLLI
ncbi:MAG: methylated-DNA--[protein]-cysteine S-methyltransferase [Pseudomonadota bacterium]